MQIETTQELTLPLSDEQAMSRAKTATERMKALQKFDDEYSILKREKNKERKEMNNHIQSLINDFSSKTTLTQVKCVKVLDLESGDKWYEYEGEKYSREPMTETEIAQAKQTPLLGVDADGVIETDDDHDPIFSEDNVPDVDVFEPALHAVE